MNPLLSDQLTKLEQQRAQCAPLVEKLKAWPLETTTSCNVCGNNRLVTVSKEDRYRLPVRAAMCLHCGLIFLVDRFTTQGYTDFYREYYRPLVSRRSGRAQNPTTMQREQVHYGEALARVFSGLLALPTGSTLLDIGGSTGVVADVFQRHFGVKATILDPSPSELEVASAHGHRTVCGLLETWDVTGEQFDLILCGRTIDHFLDLKGSLLKMKRLCKPDGRLLIDIIDVEAIRQNRGLIEGAIKVDHCYYLCSEVAPAILAAGGWEVVNTEIAAHQDRVTYLCRPVEPRPAPKVPGEWLVHRLRLLQRNAMDVAVTMQLSIATERTGPLWELRRKLYSFKRRLAHH